MPHASTQLSTNTPTALVLSSYFIAIVINIMALSSPLFYWLPPIALLVLLYWSTLNLKQTFIPSAFVLGLLYDAIQQSLLGFHAALFVVITFIILRYRLQFRLFTLLQQALFLSFLLGLYQALQLLLNPNLQLNSVGLSFWLSPLSVWVLWPLVSLILNFLRLRFSA